MRFSGVVIHVAFRAVCSVARSFAAPRPSGQAADKPPQAAVDTPQQAVVAAEYRKFEKVAAFLRARNAEQFGITSAKGIDEAKFVVLGGIEQWVTIRGQDRDNPVLLFLHGGPGDVTNPWTFALFAPWLRYFTVAQWDQRGAGRTLRKTGAAVAPTLTIERLVQDGIELADYLRKRLAKDKIIVVAHSFGSILGVRMARARPDLFHAYVGTAQVADETRNYAVAYDALLQKAGCGRSNCRRRIEPRRAAALQVGRRISDAAEMVQRLRGRGQLPVRHDRPDAGRPRWVGPGPQRLHRRPDAERRATGAADDVPPSARFGTEFSVPIFFIQGDEDFTTPTSLAASISKPSRRPARHSCRFREGILPYSSTPTGFWRSS